MPVPPVVVAIEPGPASYAALLAAADVASALGAPLEAHALGSSACEARSALRRAKLAGRKRALEVSFLRPARPSLAVTAEAARHASLLVVSRAPSGRPGAARALALSRLLCAEGPPLLVVSRRREALGERVLVAETGQFTHATSVLYELLRPLVRGLSILRYRYGRDDEREDPGLELVARRAFAREERIVHAREQVTLGEATLHVARIVRPTLLAVASPARAGAFAQVIFPEAPSRVIAETTWTALVARTPAHGWRVSLGRLLPLSADRERAA